MQNWSAAVTHKSDALNLEPRVFSKAKPAEIAPSLKRLAEQSARRKSAPFQSAMSLLTFFINRAGANLPKSQFKVLQRARHKLRKAFGRE
jgi:Protein of unknown function (DUF3175)